MFLSMVAQIPQRKSQIPCRDQKKMESTEIHFHPLTMQQPFSEQLTKPGEVGDWPREMVMVLSLTVALGLGVKL